MRSNFEASCILSQFSNIDLPCIIMFRIICCLPAGIVARQLLSTFTAESATATGVRTSSHAGEEARINTDHTRQKGKKNQMHLKGIKKRKKGRKKRKPTFSAAGHGALEGAWDGLSGFLLSRSLFQRHRVDQVASGRRHLSSNKRETS